MPFAMNFYHDQIAAGGATAAPLPGAHRLIYVRHGRVTINGQTMTAGAALYCGEPLQMTASEEWGQLWRWDIAPPNVGPALQEGEGVLSNLKMSRVISTLAMAAGTRWVLRLDQVSSPAGHVADRHQHPGPGIRCLLEGTFNVQQDAESARNLLPGDAWWETGSDTVVAWGSRQMATRFVRGMVLPVEWEGKRTGTWLSGIAPGTDAGVRANWQLLAERIVAV